MSLIRLDKYLADAGIGTRSQVKSYIRKGLVTISNCDGSKYIAPIKPETRINTDENIVVFNNEIIKLSEFEYYIMNKPAGYVCANRDDISPTVLSLLDSKRKDLFTVGRLDKDTEGLLLITNDGALSHYLLSPKHHVEKTYYAILNRPASEEMINEFADGLYIGDEDLDTALPARLEILDSPIEALPSCISMDNDVKTDTQTGPGFVKITICEGKYHQVKRMFQKKGLSVLYLKRISFGALTLPVELSCGSYRELTEEELSSLSLSIKASHTLPV